MGSPRPVAPSDRAGGPGQSSSSSPASDGDARGLRLWLLEPGDSPYIERITSAAAEAGLSVVRLDTLESAPTSASLIGVGPSITDPLRVARQLRASASQPLLIFFAASTSARNAVQAELVRDPFVYPRYEIVELPNNPRQLAARMGKIASEIQHRLHIRRTSRRGRGRGRSPRPRSESHSASLLSHVLAQTRDAILSTDEHGRAVTWNEPATRLLGVAEGAGSEILDRPEQRELAELIRDVLATGTPREAHITCRSQEGKPIQALASVAPIGDQRGARHGTTVVVRDDSEYQRIQAALHEANRQKDEFLAIMSHELRTPLTSILGYTDMLMRGLSGPLAPLANKYVGNVRSAGDRLLELVNSLLDYTRLEAGVERLELRKIDLARVIGHAVQMCQGVAQSKGVELRLMIREGLDTIVEADEDRVTNVFRTMLSNALKFTPAGGWIHVTVEPAVDKRPGVRVSVSDSGVGMRSEQVGRVWERFYQGDSSLTRPYGGMGLGLSIARHLVAMHGGAVGAESRGPGLGSTFWFSLPRRPAS